MTERPDIIEVATPPELYVRWPGGGGFQQAEVRVNGVGLVEIVREAERLYAELEYDRRVAAGDDLEALGPRGSLGGSYLYGLGRAVLYQGALVPRSFWGFARAPVDSLG